MSMSQGACPACGRELADSIGRPQRLVVLRQDDFECRQVLGKRRHVGEGYEVCRLPAEHLSG